MGGKIRALYIHRASVLQVQPGYRKGLLTSLPCLPKIVSVTLMPASSHKESVALDWELKGEESLFSSQYLPGVELSQSSFFQNEAGRGERVEQVMAEIPQCHYYYHGLVDFLECIFLYLFCALTTISSNFKGLFIIILSR